jgi:hypothetical protein
MAVVPATKKVMQEFNTNLGNVLTLSFKIFKKERNKIKV